jgi:hypothetical protein
MIYLIEEFILPIAKIWSVACMGLQFQSAQWRLKTLAMSGMVEGDKN